MTYFGRQDGPVLVVDLSDRRIESWPELWDALVGPCGLPSWFGRNLDAWWDTIQAGGVSTVLDEHSRLVVRLRAEGLFADHCDGHRFVATTNHSDYADAELVPP